MAPATNISGAKRANKACGEGAIGETSHSHARPAPNHRAVVASVDMMMVMKICPVEADSAVKR